jgi:hypothetical protein
MNREDIDKQAEREGRALAKQGRREQREHVRQQTSDYNREQFERLFR